jgi:hypothetical protein
MKSRRETPLQSRCAPREISRNIDSSKALLEFFMAKYEDNSAIGIGPFSCRFQRRVGPNGQLLHPPDGQSNRIPGRPENKAFHRNASTTLYISSIGRTRHRRNVICRISQKRNARKPQLEGQSS